ncbi:MAG: hypothetical protein OES13_12080 [Acidimicrobiia bacterium]|nr:hypothetical protein [Acidimicrobiia bacterium]
MEFNNLSTGQKVGLVSGVVLLFNLFLPWYGNSAVSRNAFEDPAGFLAFGGSFLAIAGAVILFLKASGRADASRGTMAAEQMAALVAAIGTILILLQWLRENDFTKFGLYLGLIAAFGVTYGAYLVMKDKGMSMPDIDDLKSLGSDDDSPS